MPAPILQPGAAVLRRADGGHDSCWWFAFMLWCDAGRHDLRVLASAFFRAAAPGSRAAGGRTAGDILFRVFIIGLLGARVRSDDLHSCEALDSTRLKVRSWLAGRVASDNFWAFAIAVPSNSDLFRSVRIHCFAGNELGSSGRRTKHGTAIAMNDACTAACVLGIRGLTFDMSGSQRRYRT